MSKPKWEVDDEAKGFAHRVRLGDEAGRWVGYESIATLGKYRAVTQYYDGIFPTECVFEIKEIK